MSVAKKISIAILVLLMVGAIVFVACFFTIGDGGRIASPTNITQVENMLSWDNVKAAIGYEVTEADKASVTTTTPNFKLTQKGVYEVTIIAKSGKKIPRDSKPVKYVVSENDTRKMFLSSFASNSAVNTKNYASGDASMKFYHTQDYEASGKGKSIAIPTVSGQNITGVSGGYGLTNGDFTIEGNSIQFNYDYLNQFSVGAELTFNVELSDGSVYKFYLAFTDKEMPLTTLQNYTFIHDLASGSKDIEVGFNSKAIVNGLSVNGYKIPESTLKGDTTEIIPNWEVATTPTTTTLTLKTELISMLGVGSGLFALHTSLGDVFFLGALQNSTHAVCNVSYDYDRIDESITWNYYSDDAIFIVKIGDITYKSNQPISRFNGSSFSLEGLSIEAGTKIFVSAEKDGKLTSEVGVVYNPPSEKKKEYIKKTFDLSGNIHNYYITSADELEQSVVYMITSYQRLEYVKDNEQLASYRGMAVYIEPSVVGTSVANDALKRVLAMIDDYKMSYRESLKLGTAVMSNGGNEFTLCVNMKSSNTPTGKTDGADSEAVRQDTSIQPYKTNYPRESTYNSFAIDKVEKTARVDNSDELYFAIENGCKPQITDSATAALYEKIRQVMREICSDDMTEFQKVNAIYDWVCYTSSYDNAAIIEMDKQGNNPNADSYNKFYKLNCFFLEGVFNDGIAVCNGYAKAFVVMCGIEGIKAVKTNGDAGGAHAWNKVYVNNSWYVIDITWGNKKVLQIGSGALETICDDYLLFPKDATSGWGYNDAKRKEANELPLNFISNNVNFSMEAQKMFILNGKPYTQKMRKRNDIEARSAVAEYYAKYMIGNKVANMSFSVAFIEGDLTRDTQANALISTFKSISPNLNITKASCTCGTHKTKGIVGFNATYNIPEQPEEPGQPPLQPEVPLEDESDRPSNPERYFAEVGKVLDLKLPVVLGESVQSVKAVGLTSENYSVSGGTVSFGQNYTEMFSAGALIPVEFTLSSGYTLKRYLQFVDKRAYSVVGSNYGLIDIAEFSDEYFKIAVDNALPSKPSTGESIQMSLGGSLLDYKSGFWSVSVDRKTILVKTELFKKMGTGEYAFTFHTTNGDFYFSLIVKNSKPTIKRVNIDIDKGFGDELIVWEYDGKVDGFKVEILGNTYDVASNEFNATATGFSLIEGQIIRVYPVVGGVTLLAEKGEFVFRPPGNYELARKYAAQEFNYLGKTYNYYINSIEEYRTVFHAVFMRYDLYLDNVKTKFDYSYNGKTYAIEDYWTKPIEYYTTIIFPLTSSDPNVRTLTSFLFNDVPTEFVEARKFIASYYYTIGDSTENVISTKFYFFSSNEAQGKTEVPPAGGYQPPYNADITQDQNVAESKYFTPHYQKPDQSKRAGGADNFVFNIDKKSDLSANAIETSDELAFTLENGFKPRFSTSEKGQKALALYNEIKKIIYEIISDDMTDFDKIHAMFDWVCANVRYDYNAIAKYNGITPDNPAYDECYGLNCYYIEGVIMDRIAVCNGLAKTISVMCAIEGIKCIKVVGDAGGAHAWNKVYLAGSWYLLDSTWGNAAVNINDTFQEIIGHSYILYATKDEAGSINTSEGNRIENNTYTKQFLANDLYYEAFASQVFVGSDGKVYDHIISNSEEIKFFVEYYINELKNGNSINFKLATGLNVSLTMKAMEAEARTLLSNPTFALQYINFGGEIVFLKK